MYLESKPVLHVVDSATSFNAGRFLKKISIAQVWEVFWLCWIDVYQGLPDWVVVDAGKQLISEEVARKFLVVVARVRHRWSVYTVLLGGLTVQIGGSEFIMGYLAFWE